MNSSRLESLRQFLEKEPNDSFTKYAIALEYASLKDFSKSVAMLESLIIHDPDYVPAYHQLGNIHAQLDRVNEAIRSYEHGIEAAERTGDHHAQREMQEAIDDLDEGDH